jgi:probable addiction module antidote protein
MTIETKPFDVAEVLSTEERISAYLEEAFDSGDTGFVVSAIGDVARARNLSASVRNKRDNDGQRCRPKSTPNF